MAAGGSEVNLLLLGAQGHRGLCETCLKQTKQSKIKHKNVIKQLYPLVHAPNNQKQALNPVSSITHNSQRGSKPSSAQW